MTLYGLDASFKFTSVGDDAPLMEDWLDSVSDHLDELHAKDVSIVSEGESSAFTISLVVEVKDDAEIHDVVKVGISTLRTAFHACGAGTPDWPTTVEAMGIVSISLVETSQRVLVSQ